MSIKSKEVVSYSIRDQKTVSFQFLVLSCWDRFLNYRLLASISLFVIPTTERRRNPFNTCAGHNGQGISPPHSEVEMTKRGV